jgi:hypothetical protein
MGYSALRLEESLQGLGSTRVGVSVGLDRKASTRSSVLHVRLNLCPLMLAGD